MAEKKPEVVGEIGIVTNNDFATIEVFGMKLLAIRGKYIFRFRTACGVVVLERCQGFYYFAFGANLDMDVVALEYPAKIGVVRCARAQTFDRRVFIAEGL